MKKNFLLLAIFTTFLCQSQTKVIAHKSHSGSKYNFSKAYKNKLFDSASSNFGLPGDRTLYKLESVIAINDSVTILNMYKSKVCYQFRIKYSDLKPSDYEKITDTVVNHAVFNKKNSIKFIKSQTYLKYKFFFSNPLDDVIFIGFKRQ